VTEQKLHLEKNSARELMPHVHKGLISVLIFGNENFPVLPAPFHCMIQSTIKGADEYMSKVPVEVIYVGVSDSDSSLASNLTRLAKISPASALIAIVKDFAEAELAFSTGAADCVMVDRCTAEVAAEKARFAIARMRYLKHGGGNHLYTYSDLAAIARVLSHDIRNSLSGIVLSLEPIRQACEQHEDAKSYLEILERSSTKLNQIVNRFSTATGNIALKASEEKFNDIVRQSISNMPPGAVKDVHIITKYAESDSSLLLDKEKILTAFEHLISNAIDAVDGHPNAEIRITTAVDRDAATLTIRDNGHGIDYTTLQNIFRPFFTTRPGKAGLGLSIAYSIVNAHSGTLRINSDTGGGTEVICRFPLKR
jgi:signal transduction histidine kinase